MHDKLKKMLPWGIKSEVLRELIATLIKAQEADQNNYIVQDLLDGRCSLVVQNVNKLS